MPKRKLDHAGLRIQEVDRSRAFYEGLLGLAPLPRPDFGFPGMWYDLGGAQLHLLQNEPSGTAIDPTAPHFAVEVDDIDALRERLRQAGVELFELTPQIFWVRDPDGNTVEIRTAEAFR